MVRKLALMTIAVLLVSYAYAQAARSDQDDKPQKVELVQGPRVEHVDTHQAVIAWSTNVNSSTIVRYGTDPDHLDKTAEAPWGGLTHRVTISGLQPDTEYHFVVESNQGQGTGTGASHAGQFHTASGVGSSATTAQTGNMRSVQVQAGPIVQTVTDRSAAIWWETNRPAQTIVRYGARPDDLEQVKSSPGSDQTHRVELDNLTPNTTYYAAIMDAEGAPRTTTEFKTAPAGSSRSARLRIINGPVIEYLSDKSAIIAWSTNQQSSTVLHYGTDPNHLSQSASGEASQGTHRVELKDLRPNTVYYFAVESAQPSRADITAKSTPAPFQTTARGEAALRISMQK